jgi:hypothetical protein
MTVMWAAESRLPQPGVNDLDPRVAKGPCQNLDTTIVPVQTDLGQKNAGRRVT